MKGSRKFWITILALVCFTIISCVVGDVEFMGLGLGIGFIITPTSVANAYEHRYDNKQ